MRTVNLSGITFEEGTIFNGWTDGVKNYKPGDTISNVSNNITLTAVFTKNGDSGESSSDTLGDVDGDGEVTKDDIQLITRYVNGKAELTEEQLKRADMNQDGIVDVTDIRLLEKKVRG